MSSLGSFWYEGCDDSHCCSVHWHCLWMSPCAQAVVQVSVCVQLFVPMPDCSHCLLASFQTHAGHISYAEARLKIKGGGSKGGKGAGGNGGEKKDTAGLPVFA